MKRCIRFLLISLLLTSIGFAQTASHSGGWQSRATIVLTDSAVRLTATAIACKRVTVQALPTNSGWLAVGVTKAKITAATNASPIVITSQSHGLTTGQRVTITGVLGNTAANNDWTVTVVTVNTFSLQGSTGNAAYISGGIWTDISAVGGYQKGVQLGPGGAVTLAIDDVSQVWINGTANDGAIWSWDRNEDPTTIISQVGGLGNFIITDSISVNTVAPSAAYAVNDRIGVGILKFPNINSYSGQSITITNVTVRTDTGNTANGFIINLAFGDSVGVSTGTDNAAFVLPSDSLWKANLIDYIPVALANTFGLTTFAIGSTTISPFICKPKGRDLFMVPVASGAWLAKYHGKLFITIRGYRN